jgi:lipoyl(octanoyl) transferase
VKIRALGLVAYQPTWRAMQAFNAARDEGTQDQLWLVEHPPVFTLGLAGRPEHVVDPGEIPVVKTDRGGQVTYHGPGQAVIYTMMDLRRAKLGVKALVRQIEEAVIETLSGYGIQGARRTGMPGVYVREAKIAAIGLRIARGSAYHGVALNSDLDLAPFSRIDPCGYPGLSSTRLADQGVFDRISNVHARLAASLVKCLTPP